MYYKQLFFFVLLGILYLQVSLSHAQGQQRIAVLELKNQATKQIDKGEIEYLSNEIRRIAGYLPVNRYLVMTKENMEEMIPPDKTLEDCQGSCEVKTGRLLVADWIITGGIIKFGSSLRVSLKLHNTRTSAFVKGERAGGKSVEDLEKPIQRAALSLVLSISKEFKDKLVAKAGVDRKDQLKCVLNPGECKAGGSVGTVNSGSKTIDSGDAEYEAEMARLEKEERLKKIHEQKVDREWAKVEKLSRNKPERGPKFIRVFLKKYKNHPLGNPCEFDAEGLLTELEEKIRVKVDAKKLAHHKKTIREKWGRIQSKVKGLKRKNKRKIKRGIAEIKSLLSKYEGHELGNPFEGEIRSGLEYLESLLAREGGQSIKVKGIEFVRIPSGSFMMGSNDKDSDEKPVHEVRLKGFYLSKTEVTVGQYRKCVDAGVCSRISGCNWGKSTWSDQAEDKEDHPITCVDWKQARKFAKWVGGDLPSEAQWEFAARGGKGSQFTYAGSNHLDEVGWYKKNTNQSGTRSVGQKKANGYGLYDMSGNVWEWTLDEYTKSYSNTPRDGSPQCSNSSCTGSLLRVYRGGSWDNAPSYSRIAIRYWVVPYSRAYDRGFRVLRSK